MSNTTVKVSNISPGATERDIKEFFSLSGEIIYVEMQSDSGWSQIAFVTFKDSQGAETAILLSEATIVDSTVTVALAPEYQRPPAALAVAVENEGKAPNGAPSAFRKAEDVVSSLLARGYVLGKDAMGKAKTFDEKHQLTSTASAKIDSFDKRLGLSEKINVGSTVSMDIKDRSLVCNYQKLAISLMFFVATGFCDEVSSLFSEVGKSKKDSISNNSNVRPFCVPRQYIMQSYFEYYQNLDDSGLRDFIVDKLPSGSCENFSNDLNIARKAAITERILIGEGSHRHLSTSIRIRIQREAASEISDRCNLIVVEKLPSGVFADPFELQHLQQRGVFADAGVFGDTNLELPSFRSNRSTVEIHMEVGVAPLRTHHDEGEINVKLPLHARYQPLEDSGYIKVVFGEPSVFLCWRTKGKHGKQCCILLISHSKSQTKAVSWKIPAGLRAHSQLVFAITFATAIASALSTVLVSVHSSYAKAGKSFKQS